MSANCSTTYSKAELSFDFWLGIPAVCAEENVNPSSKKKPVIFSDFICFY
jgi:hypothetical protein